MVQDLLTGLVNMWKSRLCLNHESGIYLPRPPNTRFIASGRITLSWRRLSSRLSSSDRPGKIIALDVADAGAGLEIGEFLERLQPLDDDIHAE